MDYSNFSTSGERIIWWESFCGDNSSIYDAFWTDSLTLYTTKPDLSVCLQKSVMTGISCGFLWLTSLLYVPYLYCRTEEQKGWSRHNVLKIVISLLLVVVSISDLIWYAVNHAKPVWQPVDYSDAAIDVLTYLLAAMLTRWTYTKAIHSSGILFLFWFLQLLFNIFILRSLIIRPQPLAMMFTFVTTIIRFVLIVSSFFTVLFSDIPPSGGQYRSILRSPPQSYKKLKEEGREDHMNIATEEEQCKEELVKSNPCPQLTATFLSSMFFWWFTSKVYRGWRKTLQTVDIWDIRPVDSCARIVPVFEKNWKKEFDKKPLRQSLFEPKKLKSDLVSLPFGNRRSPSRSLLMDESEDKDKVGDKSSDSPKKVKTLPSLLKALCLTFLPFYMLGGILLLSNNLIGFINPLLLSLLLDFIQSSDPFAWRGYLYAVIMFCSSLCGVVFMHQHFNITYTTGMRVKTALTAAIYRKALSISPSSRKLTTVGEIVNLMSVDSQKIQDSLAFCHWIWTAPIMVSIASYFLWQILGPSTLAGLAFMILVLPINSAIIALRMKVYQTRQMHLKDSRIKLMSQIISGIKILKLYAWEMYFGGKVLEIREEELAVLRKAAVMNALTYIMWFSSSFIVALLCFTSYVLSSSHNILDAQKAFVSLSLLMLISFPLTMLPPAISFLVQAKVSLVRIQKFLCQDNVAADNVTKLESFEDAVSIKDGWFLWDADGSPILKNINVSVGSGQLIAVVGMVGCGKSSLLSAMLGEMEKVKGSVNLKGSVAYVAQQAWIQNLTLKDNILFSKPFERDRYEQLLDACALRPDIAMLPAGDSTEIGERGINLSGGQKQRVSLARAVYQDTDVYLLDDTLSAVDAHVGKHIFNNVIGPEGLLRNKTRVWVTHSVSYLFKVDNIIVMKDGEISEMGTFNDLLSHRGAFADFINLYLTESGGKDDEIAAEVLELKRQISSVLATSGKETEVNEAVSSAKSMDDFVLTTDSPDRKKSTSSPTAFRRARSVPGTTESSPLLVRSARKRRSTRSSYHSEVGEEEMMSTELRASQLPSSEIVAHIDGGIIQEEIVEEGAVKLSVLKSYLSSASPLFSIVVAISFAFFIVFQVSTNIWLSNWTQDVIVNNTQDYHLTSVRLGVYGMLGAGQVLTVLGLSLSISIGSICASRTLHTALLQNILRCPSSFFDTTPLGRIINRFSKDVDILDANIPQFAQNMLMTLSPLLSTVIIIIYSTPIFVVVVVPLFVFFIILQRVYVTCARQIKRIDSICRSPLYAFFSETLNGVSSIRAFNRQQSFISHSDILLDNSQRVWFETFTSNRWIGVWAELIGDIVILFTAVFAVLQRDTLNSGLVGLSLSFALQINMSIVFTLRSSCELETYIVAVERMKEYSEQENEAPWVVPDQRPPLDWPVDGLVEFKSYETRYRPGLELVLKGISCKIQPKEKIGLVGRTGAGKSSLTLALFRIIEPTNGSIEIDGRDISTMGLHDLRNRLTVIPQDPVLFSGSLRFNLDPSDQFTDDEVWEALTQAHLKNFVESLADKIDHECGEDGENLSVGQRQLVCLARALLRKSKILVLDEATAAVDLETDDLIQTTIRAEFKDCTVLTIAHRLNTIIDYERIIVLDNGKISEIGNPTDLLKNKNSIFYSMARDAGLVNGNGNGHTSAPSQQS